ncbi:exodeoxyribonuclease VII small subunit [Leeia oryzae]|uniref:exodeoxyribonuclease VII small subunit n=1 Tax=Leeia oryzae TaxID=356662 RepID=UPI00035FB3FA|nr:exodeoxyribonuclease VII small subunit [Leeia oryzae]
MAKAKSTQSFEEALAELESIVAQMESGQLPLEASLSTYGRGTELLKYCQGLLSEAQQKVQILTDNQLQPLETSDDSE